MLLAVLVFWYGISNASYTANSYMSDTAEGTVRAHVVYKEGMNVTPLKINDRTSLPADLDIDGKPNSDIHISWENEVIVKDKEKRSIKIELNNPESASSKIGNDSKFGTQIEPKPLASHPKDGSFNGNYNLNVVY